MKNWRIGVRIGAGFAVATGICVLLAFFAINRTAEISKKTEDLSSNYFPSLQALYRVQSNLQFSVSALLQLVLSDDEKRIAQLNGEVSTAVAAEEKDLQFYESTPFTAKEAALYAAAKATRPQFFK